MNQETYAIRMENNVDDKLIILDFVEDINDNSCNILDFGCGSGSIYKDLSASYPNARVVGFDKSEFMIKRAKQNHPSGTFLSRFEELKSFVEKESNFEYIILNSILHEVYSYENGYVSIVELLENLSSYLTKSGKFVVRDGILDIDSVKGMYQTEEYVLRNPVEAQIFLEEYKYLSPFPIHLQIKDGSVVGPWYEVREFLNKYTWGFESLYREAKEIVNFASLDVYRLLFSKINFNIDSLKLVNQEEYFSYLDKIVKIGDTRWNTKIVFSASQKS